MRKRERKKPKTTSAGQKKECLCEGKIETVSSLVPLLVNVLLIASSLLLLTKFSTGEGRIERERKNPEREMPESRIHRLHGCIFWNLIQRLFSLSPVLKEEKAGGEIVQHDNFVPLASLLFFQQNEKERERERFFFPSDSRIVTYKFRISSSFFFSSTLLLLLRLLCPYKTSACLFFPFSSLLFDNIP